LILTSPLKIRRPSYRVLALLGAFSIIIAWAWYTQPSTVFYLTAGWLVTVAVLLWWGNRQLTLRFDKLLPWSRWGNLRFFIHLTLGLLYLLVLMNLSYLALKLMLTTDPPTVGQILTTNLWGAVIFIPVFSIYFSLHFLKHWRRSELAAEKIQKENMRSQLNSLKSQLDPHFLFNNLNILSALIDSDPQRSKKFVDKFAEVYRALLQSKASDDLILLSEELEFIDAYMYLIRTRFDNNIQFTRNLKPGFQTRMIPPLTLQLLIENAIKHNLIHDGSPLTIHLLQIEDDYLMISNSLNEKNEKQERKGSGLLNIQNRYAYFTDKPVRILKTDSHFEVHIPLLEIEQA
jgi:hypothetical protein